MKRLIVGVVFILLLGVCLVAGFGEAFVPTPIASAQPVGRQELANRERPLGRIAFVTRITPTAAPSGAVIQLSVQSAVSDVKTLLEKYRLTIGGSTTQFYAIDESDQNTIAAVVPSSFTPNNNRRENLVPVEVVFFDNFTGERGVAYNDFSVLEPTGVTAKNVQIIGVRQLADTRFLVLFNDYVPPELWGKTSIYIDGNAVQKFFKMDERSFTFELPAGVNRNTFEVFARVGEHETAVYKYPLGSTATLTGEVPSPTVSPTPQAAASKLSVTAWITVVAIAAVFIFYFFGRFRRGPVVEPESYLESATEVYSLDHVPKSLVDACVAGECVLYAGAGVAAQAGLPTWSGLVKGLLNWAEENRFITKEEANVYRADVDRGQADPVADSVVSRLTVEQQQTILNSYLQHVFLKRTAPTALHSQLKDINFAAVLTTNFDNLLDKVYDVNPQAIYTPKDADQLLAALTRRAFFILKLYGRLDQKETVIVAPAQYKDAITGNTLFPQFMQTLFFSRTLLFVGASLEGIKTYLEGISLPRNISRKHYAVVAVSGAWRAQAELLERRFGIHVLPFTPSGDYAELRTFLKELADEVVARKNETTKGLHKGLKRVTLENIGPFEHLSLELARDYFSDADAPDDSKPGLKWDVFLGDNGVGKSTVLKAIALALCGKEAQPYAGRLLRDTRRSKDDPFDEIMGTITLDTSNTTYVTTLRRDKRGEVELASTTARPLEAEGWLAVGFPPLRTTSWDPAKSPSGDTRLSSRPEINDLLPLVTGDVDPRLDKLKDWIIKLDYRDAKDKGSAGRYTRLIQKMFDVIGEVAEGMKLTYKGVVPEGDGNRILIETSDGVLVPLEGLSQGTISLIGWIGILMQRLYEVFGDDEDPTNSYALVLMDEIDAHMHPLWQRTLITHLKELFPKAQFVATTHSPLVIAGLPASQVVRFARDENGDATTLPVPADMTHGYTDQILTSLLFGLPTALGAPTEKKMDHFYQLDQTKGKDGKPGEYEQLRKEIIAEVPPWSASYEEKHSAMRSRALVLKEAGERLKLLSNEEAEVMLARADHLMKTLGEDDNDKG